MIIDATGLEPGGTALAGAAICIVGSGPAGLSMASRLAKAGRDVIVLEAGGHEISEQSQDIYRGENVGDPYLDLDTSRLRYFGGTSNHWGGWTRPLTEGDFHRRDGVPMTGWPIGKRDLDPYFGAAADFLGIGTFPADRPLIDGRHAFAQATWQFAGRRRLARLLEDEIAASPRIRLVLNANVVDFDADEASGEIREVIFRRYGADSPSFAVAAPAFVLACGAIENARLLLNADRQFAGGLGNRHGMVGGCFMEHPHFDVGTYIDLAGRFPDPLNFVVTEPAFEAREGILGCAIVLHEYLRQGRKSPAWPAFVQQVCEWMPDAADTVLGLTGPGCAIGRIRVMSEQAPNPDSRVLLGRDRDALGLRRVRLDWRKTELDRRTVRRTAIEFGAALASSDIGRLRLAGWLQDPADAEWPDNNKYGGPHHMGTTRMAATPRDGVVDRNCRVFGHPNLYVAGSGVFTTGGYANPTLTVVQLALRLADRLAEAT